MKRIGTAFVIFLSLIAISAHSQVQVSHSTQKQLLKAETMTTKAQSAGSAVKIPSSPTNNDQPLTIYKTEGVSYLQDTSSGNWWVYAPILNRSTGDSLGYFHFDVFGDGELLYFTNDDTIGPIDIDTNTNQSDPPYVAFDTMYNRVMCIRVTPPTDLGTTIHLDSANLIFYPESMSSSDEIRVWAVQVSDDPGGYPFPDLISETPIAEETIPASKITVGQMNSLTVSFGSKQLNTAEKNEIAICAFVDGPNFPSDTIGYFLEADANAEFTQSFNPDTDGSAMLVPGPDTGSVPMRTYLLGLDGGHLSIAGNPPNYVGGGGDFFVDITQVDQTGAPTGNAFDGNVGITTYFHGTVTAGVSASDANAYSLDQNYPNPVSTTSDISYNLANSGPVSLKVYNQLGEEVETVVNGSIQGVGAHEATFNSANLPDGMYYYKLQSGEFTATQSLVITR